MQRFFVSFKLFTLISLNKMQYESLLFQNIGDIGGQRTMKTKEQSRHFGEKVVEKCKRGKVTLLP